METENVIRKRKSHKRCLPDTALQKYCTTLLMLLRNLKYLLAQTAPEKCSFSGLRRQHHILFVYKPAQLAILKHFRAKEAMSHIQSNFG